MADISSEAAGIGVPVETTALAATPGSNASIIKVSDDAPVLDENPTGNYDDQTLLGGLFIGNDTSGWMARTWLKFNLTHLPDNVHFSRATVNLFFVGQFGTEDLSVGIYYSEDDTWLEDTITWNNQPEFEAQPTDFIDSPASPDMFVMGNWYEWEITSDVIQTLEEDGVLTLVLKQVDETPSNQTGGGYASREYSITNEMNTIPYISLEYSIPTTSELKVDGFSESPHIDYIQSANPEFSWTFADADPDDFQRNYELEVWNNQYFNDTPMMLDRNSEYKVVHDTADVGSGNSRPFATNSEMRFQFKWPAVNITQSGVVDKLYFEMDEQFGETTFSRLEIYMLCVTNSSALGSDFQTNYDGRTPIKVLNRTSYTAITDHGFMVFDIENTFIIQEYLDLIIEIRHWGFTGTEIGSNHTDVGGSVAYTWGTDAYSSDTAVFVVVRTHGLRLELVSHEVFSEAVITNLYPFAVSIGSSGRFQLKYNRSLINQAGLIDRILFPVAEFESVSYENFSVYLCETTLEGELNHTAMDSNYAGVTPTLVLDVEEYTIHNTGKILVIDVDDVFYYSNTSNLLIELRFDSLDAGYCRVQRKADVGGYRAWQLSSAGSGSDSSLYNMFIDFIFDIQTVEYTGIAMTNATTYYWRVRTCDSLGLWSPWTTGSFTYSVLESQPDWSGLIESADPIEFGGEVTVSITVTHTIDINQVLIEYEGSNYTMTQSIDLFSWTWTPTATGANGYTIYMEANSGVWGTTSGSISVEDTISPEWVTTPVDQVLDFGEALSYQLDATDLSGIDSWNVNDTVNFSVVDGLLTNTTNLPSGSYPLLLTVNDNEGNDLSATITIQVLPSSTSTTTTTTTTTTDTIDTTDTTDTDTTSSLPDGGNITMILIIGGVIGAVVIIIIVVQKRKG